MKLITIAIYKNDVNPATELCAEFDLSTFSRFTKGNIQEFCQFTSKTIAERTRPGQRQSIAEGSYVFHVYGRSEGICGVIISDEAYPSLVAHQVLGRLLDAFLSEHPIASFQSGNKVHFPQAKEYLQKYQDPTQADSIMKIQNELDETKILMKKTIESVLERGEKIDNIVAKSEALSTSSKAFYTQARKQNSCCSVM